MDECEKTHLLYTVTYAAFKLSRVSPCLQEEFTQTISFSLSTQVRIYSFSGRGGKLACSSMAEPVGHQLVLDAKCNISHNKSVSK